MSRLNLVRWLCGIFVFAALLTGNARGQELVKVGVVPFRVYAADTAKSEASAKRVVQVLAGELAKEERVIMVNEADIQKAIRLIGRTESDEETAREAGRELEADFMVFGSLTQIGDAISIDAQIVQVRAPGILGSAFAASKGPQDLDAAARKLAGEIVIRVLRKEKITKILIEGNRAIEENAIRAQLKMKEGDIFSPRELRDDLKAVFQMGYFQDVRAERRDWERGLAIVIVVEEKPFIREIRFSGNKKFKAGELLEAIPLKPRTILNLNTVKESVNKIIQKYQEEAYFAAEVTYELEGAREREVLVRYKIKEGTKIRIRKITFSGNFHFSDRELKKQLPETKEKGLLSFLTKSGTYREETLEQDLDGILAFYMRKGFFQAKVGKPQVTHDQKWITITIPVDEGRQFRIGSVDIRGDLIFSKAEIAKKVPLYPGEILNRDKIRDSVSNLTDMYADQGYAFADISPQTVVHKETEMVDLTLEIKKGSLVYIERINIQGNTKTRDKVIRRDMRLAEGDLFNLSALKKSRERLNALGYFKEINMTPRKGSAEDKLDIDVRVEEAPTGAFSIGGGYSSLDKLVGMVSISQNNLFGTGKRVILSAQIGAISQYYNLSYTDPWLFDTRISGGVDIYRIMRDYTDYSVTRLGGGLRFGFPLFEEVRGYLSYKYEQIDVFNILSTAALLIRESEGTSTTSSVGGALRRDTRDHYFDPSKGSDNTIGIEYAGGPLGGSNYFTRYSASSAWFYTPFWKTTFMVRGRIGYIQANGDHTIPIFERYRLGGISTIRGFKTWMVGPKLPNGEILGGNKELIFNVEAVFPLIPGIKLKGLVFFDAGNAYDVGEPYSFEKLRTSVGVGLRWISPMGPLRLEWGYNLRPQPDESKSSWDFSVGTFF